LPEIDGFFARDRRVFCPKCARKTLKLQAKKPPKKKKEKKKKREKMQKAPPAGESVRVQMRLTPPR